MANILGFDLMNVQLHMSLVADVHSVEFEPFGRQQHDAVNIVGVRTGPEGDGPRLSLCQAFERKSPSQRRSKKLMRYKHHRLDYVIKVATANVQ